MLARFIKNWNKIQIKKFKTNQLIKESGIDICLNPLNCEKFLIRLENYSNGEKIPEINFIIENSDSVYSIKIHMALWKSSDYILQEKVFKDLKDSFYKMKAAFSQFETERSIKDIDAEYIGKVVRITNTTTDNVVSYVDMEIAYL